MMKYSGTSEFGNLAKIKAEGNRIQMVGIPSLVPTVCDGFVIVAIVDGREWQEAHVIKNQAEWTELLSEVKTSSYCFISSVYSIQESSLLECVA